MLNNPAAACQVQAYVGARDLTERKCKYQKEDREVSKQIGSGELSIQRVNPVGWCCQYRLRIHGVMGGLVARESIWV